MSMRNPQNERYTVEREGRSQGSVKPRTASAKPASKAGASVRTTSKPKPKNAKQRAMAEMNMSKKEKKPHMIPDVPATPIPGEPGKKRSNFDPTPRSKV